MRASNLILVVCLLFAFFIASVQGGALLPKSVSASTSAHLEARNSGLLFSAQTCCAGCQYSSSCCCAPGDHRAVTRFRVRRKTRTVKRTTTRVKTVATVTRTKTVTTLAPRAMNAAPLEAEEALVPVQTKPLERRKVSNDRPTSRLEARQAQPRNLCARCPGGINVQPFSPAAGRTSGARFCCPPRRTIIKTRHRTFRKTSVITKRVSRTATVTATFYAQAQRITGILFDDLNNNNVYNVGIDTPRPFVPVVLVDLPSGRLLARAGDVLDANTTDSNGRYFLSSIVRPGQRLGISTAANPNQTLVQLTIPADGKLPGGGEIDVGLDVGSVAALTSTETGATSTRAAQTTTGQFAPPITAPAVSTTVAKAPTTTAPTTTAPAVSTTVAKATTTTVPNIFTAASCSTEVSIEPGYYAGNSQAYFTPGGSNESVIYQENFSGVIALTEFVRNNTKLKNRQIRLEENLMGNPFFETTAIARGPVSGNIYVAIASQPRRLFAFAANGTTLGYCDGPVLPSDPAPNGIAVDSDENLYTIFSVSWGVVTSGNTSFTNHLFRFSGILKGNCSATDITTPTPGLMGGLDTYTLSKNSLAIDRARGYLYFGGTDMDNRVGLTRVIRTDLDGTNVVEVGTFVAGAAIFGVSVAADGDIWVQVQAGSDPEVTIVYDKDTFANRTAGTFNGRGLVLPHGGYMYADAYSKGFGLAAIAPDGTYGSVVFRPARENTLQLAYHAESGTIFATDFDSSDPGRLYRATSDGWENIVSIELPAVSDGVAVQPSSGNLYAGWGTSVVILDPWTGSNTSVPISGLSSNVRSMAFGPNGNLYIATQDSVLEVPNGNGSPTVIATGFTIPNGTDTTEYPKGAIHSIAVDGTGNVYICTVGYYSDPSGGGPRLAPRDPSPPSVPSHIYKLAAGTWTKTTVFEMDATNTTQTSDPEEFGIRIALDYSDFTSLWYAFPIAAAGNGTAAGNGLYIGYWGDDKDVVLFPNGDPAGMVKMDAKYRESSCIAAGGGYLWATSQFFKYLGCV